MDERRIDSSSESENSRSQLNIKEIFIDGDPDASMESELSGENHQAPNNGSELANDDVVGCSHGDHCPFKENAIQAWNVTKTLSDQYERMKRLETENFQLKNLNIENKNYIASLRGKEEISTRTIEDQRSLLLEKEGNHINLEHQLTEVIRASKKNAEEAERRHTDEMATLLCKYKRAVEIIADYQKKYGRLDDDQIADNPVQISESESAYPTNSLHNQPYTISNMVKQSAAAHIAIEQSAAEQNAVVAVEPHAIEQSTAEQSATIDSFFASTPLTEKVSTEQQQNEKFDQNLPEPIAQPQTSNFLTANEQNEELSIIEDVFHPTSDPLQPKELEICDENLDEFPLEDDLMLELPPSPHGSIEAKEIECQPEQIESQPKQIEKHTLVAKSPDPPISFIFKARFFYEFLENKMPLLTDISDMILKEKEQQEQIPIEEVMKIINLHHREPKLAILRISKRFAIPKNQATLLYTESQQKRAADFVAKRTGRKRRRESSSEMENTAENDDDDDESIATSSHGTSKEEVPKNQMPWKPVMQVLPDRMDRSKLPRKTHRSYVSIIQNLLNANPKFRFEEDKKKLKAWDELLDKERKSYEQAALRTISSYKNFSTRFFGYPDRQSLDIVMNHQIRKIGFQLCRRAYQGVLREIPWKAADLLSQPPPLFFEVTELYPGQVKAIDVPDPRLKFKLDKNHKRTNRWLTSRFDKKVPITDDLMMNDYAFEHKINFLMDASTLRHFLSAPFGNRPQTTYASRVCVTREFKGGISRKVCSVFPPMVASRMHGTFVSREYLKWAFKSKLYSQSGDNQSNTQKAAKIIKKDDMAQSLLEDLKLEEIGKTARSSSSIDADKRYAIVAFNEPNSEPKHHRILVRTNVHGSEDGHIISLTVKPEFLPEVAAEKLTNEEIVWNIITALLKGSHEHINIRVHTRDFQLLQMDRKANELSRVDQNIRKIISSRIQRIYSLLDALEDLEPGEYFLFHDDEMLRIIYQKDEKSSSYQKSSELERRSPDIELNTDIKESPPLGPVYDIDWFAHIMKMKPIASHASIESYWNGGIDPHYPLQWHIVRGQIPGALYPDPRI